MTTSQPSLDVAIRLVNNHIETSVYFLQASQNFFVSAMRYATDFAIPQTLAMQYITSVEQQEAFGRRPDELFGEYRKLGHMCARLSRRATIGTFGAWQKFGKGELKNIAIESGPDFAPLKASDTLRNSAARWANISALISYGLPRAMQEVAPEYGFHFESGEHELVAETERFRLYQVAPNLPGFRAQKTGRPVLIIPPYVLGSNILAFLPGDQRSYTHAFANQGIPTYIRIMKSLHKNEAVQTMTAEDDTQDTRYLCETIKARHGLSVTLNGYCQGGYSALCNLLSGELDGLVDALITCVSPMDGTHSQGFVDFLGGLPRRFNDLAYGSKKLKNGNVVADGKLMGWVYRIKSIEGEAPMSTFLRDLSILGYQDTPKMKISKTMAALTHWLRNERTDLPLEITRVSFAAYNKPIAANGDLPVTLFGRKLNLKRLSEKKIPWLICYGEEDDLVEKEAALTPTKWVDAEVTPFPKGHVAIATSWSHPDSACALHTRFGEGNWRGPVRFQLDLDAPSTERPAHRLSITCHPPPEMATAMRTR